MEADNKVELGKILGPVGLMAGKDLGCGKVFQVLMIHDHVDRSTGTFKEVSPDTVIWCINVHAQMPPF